MTRGPPASRKRHVCETRFTSNKQKRNVPDVLSGHVTRSGMPRPSDRGSPTTTRRRIISIFSSRNKTYSIYHADRAISWQIVSRLLGISAFQHTQPASCITFTLRNKYGGYYRHASYFCSRCETAIHRVKWRHSLWLTVIWGHDTISMLCGNTAYCVKLGGEDLSRYSNI